MTDCIFNPLDKFYKSTKGAVKAGRRITFRITGDFEKVNFLYHRDGEDYSFLPMERRSGCFELSASFSVGLYWYKFDLNNGLYVGCGPDLKGVISDSPENYQLSVFSADYSVPAWLNGGIIYQIFPDRFFRSEDANVKPVAGRIMHADFHEDPVYLPNKDGEVLNNDFFGGNFRGISEKLPYLKSLNVSAIYLNPICKAYSNHRYDTGDFMKIDPMLGTENDFSELVEKAESSGIKIILDGVFNHVGADSVYFNRYGNYSSVGAYQSKKSEYYKWFDFTDYPDGYASWWGVKTLPAVNKRNPDYINYICGENGVIGHYLKFGVKGLRLDVVDELPAQFVRALRQSVKSRDKNAIIIGEVWEDASNKISYGVRREYFLGGELDSVMNYPLKNAIISFVKYGDGAALSSTIKSQIDHYPKQTLDSLMNILSTHDTARLLSAVSDVDLNGKTKTEIAKSVLCGEKKAAAVFSLKAASLLQYTLYGVPSVYYGDEIGMQGFFDPLNRRCFEWDKIDGDILSWYRLLGKIRTENSVFKRGAVKELHVSDGFYSFIRKDKSGQLLIVLNVKTRRFTLRFKGKLINLLDGKIYEGVIPIEKNFLGIFKKHV
ncbi:MAG: glycoside hydrolase family 13 protein [Clostridia bacterium]|nr:glycoside hydrolase family 13 protein [Clostridia bacterium]